MFKEELEQIANKIEKYLQNGSAYEWHVELCGDYIIGYYTNIKVFILGYDEDVEDWYVDGKHLYVDMIGEINKILQKYTN